MGLSGSCVPPVAERRFDLFEGFDVGLDDGLQALCVGRVAEGVGEPVETVTIMLLQRTLFGHRVVPALRARPRHVKPDHDVRFRYDVFESDTIDLEAGDRIR